MNSTYKIALAVAAALCLVILGYYVTQSADPSPDDGDSLAQDITESTEGSQPAPPRPTLTQPAVPRTTPNPSTHSLRPPPRSDSNTIASTLPTTTSNDRPTLRDMVNAANTPSDKTADNAPAPPSLLPHSSDTAATEPAIPAAPPTAVGANTALSTGSDRMAPNTTNADRLSSEDVAPPPTLNLGNATRPAAMITPSAPPVVITKPLTYVVESGDTFAAIAEKTYGDERYWVDIAQANPTVDPKRLKIDQVLQLPTIDEVTRADIKPPSSDRAGEIRYTVRPGDNLSVIAQQYYGDPNAWRTIFNANREALGNNPDAIEAGKVLVVPPAPGGAQ